MKLKDFIRMENGEAPRSGRLSDLFDEDVDAMELDPIDAPEVAPEPEPEPEPAPATPPRRGRLSALFSEDGENAPTTSGRLSDLFPEDDNSDDEDDEPAPVPEDDDAPITTGSLSELCEGEVVPEDDEEDFTEPEPEAEPESEPESEPENDIVVDANSFYDDVDLDEDDEDEPEPEPEAEPEPEPAPIPRAPISRGRLSDIADEEPEATPTDVADEEDDEPAEEEDELAGALELFSYQRLGPNEYVIEKIRLKKNTKTKKLSIPEGVVEIAPEAFVDNPIESVELPSTLKKIGKRAFKGTKISEVVLPEGFNSLGEEAFFACDRLSRVEIPSTLKTIPSRAFEDCVKLRKLIIAEGVINVGEYAFSGCAELEEVDLPLSVKKVKEAAFEKCPSLATIKVPAEAIYAFKFEDEYYQTHSEGRLKTVVITCGEVIPKRAFMNCYGLTSVTIPQSLLKISASAFAKCTAITDVYFDGSENDWSYIKFGLFNSSLKNAEIHYFHKITR